MKSKFLTKQDKYWYHRRFWSLIFILPAFSIAWVGAQIIPKLTPFLPWDIISPYTIGAIISTVVNTILWDTWVKLVYRLTDWSVKLLHGVSK